MNNNRTDNLQGNLYCPNCGSLVENQTANKKRKAVMFMLGLLCGLILSVVIIAVIMPSDGQKAVTTDDLKSNQLVCNIGDTLNSNGLKITFQKAEDWDSDNMLITAKDGYKFIRAYFIVENTNSSDYSMGGLDFKCYADDVKMATSIYGDNKLDFYTTISSGRKLEGYIYFEVPVNAEKIEIEYETDRWTDEKAIFKVK